MQSHYTLSEMRFRTKWTLTVGEVESVRLTACFIYKTIERISIKFDTGGLH